MITTDWTQAPAPKPFDQNKETAKALSIECLAGVQNCDVFILISDSAGTGMHIELGVALQLFLQGGKPKIFVIGEHASDCMFFFHPAINRRKSIEDVLKEI